VPGKIGQGLKFDGVDDYVRVAAPNMTGVTSISESAWVYVAAADFSGRTYVIADDEGDNFNNHGIGFYLTDNGGSIQKALMFELDVSTGNCVGKYANNVFGTRRWYHVAGLLQNHPASFRVGSSFSYHLVSLMVLFSVPWGQYTCFARKAKAGVQKKTLERWRCSSA
jgi:hypothetical protein